MNEWWQSVYRHFVAGEYVADIRGVVEDLVGSNFGFYEFEGCEKWK